MTTGTKAGIVLLILGIGISFVVYIAHFRPLSDRLSWPTVQGVTVTSNVESARFQVDPARDNYEVVVSFEYWVKGTHYLGEQRLPGGEAGLFGEVPAEADEKNTKYRSGRSVLVYYDPRNASRAVIGPSAPDPGWAIILSVLANIAGFILAGAGAIIILRNLWHLIRRPGEET